ncbi:hypothetical protein GGR58DRAFT_508167 [Xylaria digitata]|nr:hypothetical protein GGR58DRAFT_508167 [Xylaria digitata]
MSSNQDPIAELRGVASNLAGRMNWLIERIDKDGQGIETQAAKKIRLFESICESMGTISTRWENLVDSMYAEFEANQQQLTAARAGLDKERVELEASQHKLTKAQKKHNSEVEDLRRSRQKFDADWKIMSQSQLTSDKLEESLNGLHISNKSILGKLTEQHDEKTKQLRQTYEEARSQLMEKETDLSSARDQLDKTRAELREARDQLTDAVEKRNDEFWRDQDKLAAVSTALEQKLIEQGSLQRQVDKLQDQLDNVAEERKSHEETRALVSELSLQIALTREDLKTVKPERDQLKDTLAEKESSLKSSQDMFYEDDPVKSTLPPGKRLRVDRNRPQVEWYQRVEELKSLFHMFRLICPPEANISLGDSLAEFVRASDADVDHGGLKDILSDFTSEAPAGSWYCFQQIADHNFGNRDSLIEDDECYIHKDKCFQICNAGNEGYGSIYCRLKEYS